MGLSGPNQEISSRGKLWRHYVYNSPQVMVKKVTAPRIYRVLCDADADPIGGTPEKDRGDEDWRISMSARAGLRLAF
jgi:hypothetical protein